jgi:hypothetical protein
MSLRLAFAAFVLATCPLLAQAQLFRTYLASTGDDANPCTRPQPCRLLPAAIAAAADGGEVWMLDSANFNVAPVLIDKSINILAVPGAMGSVVGNNGDAIEVNGSNAKVSLRNLVILNLAGSASGVRLTNGVKLRVEGCEIYGFGNSGLYLNAPAQAVVIDTVVRDNGRGIVLDNGVSATISRSHVIGNLVAGLVVAPSAGASTTVHVSDSVLSHNGYGALLQGVTGHAAVAYVRASVVSDNANSGFYLQGVLHANDLATLHLSTTAVNRNAIGLEMLNAQVVSAGDNRVIQNTQLDRSNIGNSATFTVAPSI